LKNNRPAQVMSGRLFVVVVHPYVVGYMRGKGYLSAPPPIDEVLWEQLGFNEARYPHSEEQVSLAWLGRNA